MAREGGRQWDQSIGLICLYIFADFFPFYNFHVLLTDSCVNRKLIDGKYQYKNEASSVYVHVVLCY